MWYFFQIQFFLDSKKVLPQFEKFFAKKIIPNTSRFCIFRSTFQFSEKSFVLLEIYFTQRRTCHWVNRKICSFSIFSEIVESKNNKIHESMQAIQNEVKCPQANRKGKNNNCNGWGEKQQKRELFFCKLFWN